MNGLHKSFVKLHLMHILYINKLIIVYNNISIISKT